MAVKDLDLTISGGEIVGLIGPNGAGKTTVFNLIMGFHTADHGDVYFDTVHGSNRHDIWLVG